MGSNFWCVKCFFMLLTHNDQSDNWMLWSSTNWWWKKSEKQQTAPTIAQQPIASCLVNVIVLEPCAGMQAGGLQSQHVLQWNSFDVRNVSSCCWPTIIQSTMSNGSPKCCCSGNAHTYKKNSNSCQTRLSLSQCKGHDSFAKCVNHSCENKSDKVWSTRPMPDVRHPAPLHTAQLLKDRETTWQVLLGKSSMKLLQCFCGKCLWLFEWRQSRANWSEQGDWHFQILLHGRNESGNTTDRITDSIWGVLLLQHQCKVITSVQQCQHLSNTCSSSVSLDTEFPRAMKCETAKWRNLTRIASWIIALVFILYNCNERNLLLERINVKPCPSWSYLSSVDPHVRVVH